MSSQALNLVVVCLDTFRYDLATHQAPWPVALPNIDRLRQQSTVFTNAFGEGLPTIPMRRAYFTGERSFPWRFSFDTKGSWPTGRGWHKIPPEQPTLAEVLLARGYQTGLIADTYHLFKPTGNFTRGFLAYEAVRGYESDNFRPGKLGPKELARYVADPDPSRYPVLTQYLLNTRGRRSESDWSTAQVFSKASDWVLAASHSEPFFLWVDSFAPHEPWDPPRPYLRPFGMDAETEEMEAIYPVGYTDRDLSAQAIERTRVLYLAYLSFVDRWLGHLLDTLDRTGLARETVVMLVNDHGTELMDHGQFSKAPHRLYTHNTQMIWMIRHPDGQATSSAALVQSHDLYPTALSLLGVDHAPVAGEDVWPLRQAEPGTGRDHVIIGWGSHASVRTLQWNYIVNFENPDKDPELFDLHRDPGESQNLVEKRPEVAQDMRARLEAIIGPLPATLADTVKPSDAPVRDYFQSKIDQTKRDAGFV